MAKFDEKTTKDPFPQRAFYFSIIAFFIGIPSGNLCGVETHKKQSHTLIKGNCAVFIKYALIIANEQSRVLGGSLIEPCAIVPGAEKISNRCNIE